jgi:hypothetical protein
MVRSADAEARPMPAGYIPQWIPLLEAIEHVRLVIGGTIEEAWRALAIPLREGAILSRFRGQEVGGIAAAIEGNSGAILEHWWYDATVFKDGSVEFAAERYDFRPRAPRREIEIQRSHLLQLWPEPAEATREPAPVNLPPSRLKPFWAEAEKIIMTWLAEDGCPADRDGGQAKLEARAAELLIARGWEAGTSTIRRHVRACMERHRKNTKA